MVWYVIVKIDCVGDGERPQCCVRNVRPMSCCMQHHCAGNGHYCLNCSFSISIVVVGSDAGESSDLLEVNELVLEFF